MNVDIVKQIPLPISKSTFLPVNSTRDYLAFSTPLSQGVFVHLLVNDNNEDEEDSQSSGSSDKEDEEEEGKSPCKDVFKLAGVHESGVQYICFGNQTSKLLLATACSDEVNIWDFSSLDENESPQQYMIAQHLGSVQCMCFSNDDSNLAISISNEIWIINTESAKLVAQFVGNPEFALFMEFCHTIDRLLITLSDDRTYKIYDIVEDTPIYQSAIISSFPFLSLSVHPMESYFATGSADGMLRVFDMTLHNSLHEINIAQAINKELDDSTITEAPIISLKYWKRKSNLAQSKLGEELYLAIGCSDSFLIYNANSMEMIHILFFDYNVIDNGLSEEYKAFPSATQVDFSSGLVQAELNVSVLSPTDALYVFQVHPDHSDVNLALELMSIDPLYHDSPLKSELIQKPKLDTSRSQSRKTSNARPVKKKVDKMNQPLTFHRKVSSSGYKATPRSKMFTPQTNFSKSKNGSRKSSNSSTNSFKSAKFDSVDGSRVMTNGSNGMANGSNGVANGLKTKTNGLKTKTNGLKTKTNGSKSSRTNSKTKGNGSSRESENPVGPWGLKIEPRELRSDYPKESDPPIKLVQEIQLTEKLVPVTDMCFTDCGKAVLCALSDSSLLMAKTRNLSSVACYTDHNGIVNSCGMNHRNNYMITASSDATVKVWTPNLAEPVMTMTHLRHNLKQDDNDPVVAKANPKFTKEICKASFYFVDKFILLAQGKTLSLYSYNLDPVKDEVKRYKNKSRYKMVTAFEINDTQTITTFSAINSFYSYTAICACSNRDLVIYDMNKGVHKHTIKDAQARPVHSICQIQGSSYSGLSQESYNLFVTGAQNDGVKLWDIRTMKCVRKYEGHVNRAQKVGLSVSPCARFIAVGSEDKATYIYDIRSNSYLHCLSNHTDAVSAVAFHPQKPLLVSASYSGLLRTYNDVEYK